MIELPRMPQKKNAERVAVPARGMNFSDSTRDGDLYDAENMSLRRFPALATRKKRVLQQNMTNVSAMLRRGGKFVTVVGTSLCYDGTTIATVTAGAKQMAVVNTKLVVFPDKICYDFETGDTTGVTIGGRACTMMGHRTNPGKYDALKLIFYKENAALTTSGTIAVSGTTITVSGGGLTAHFSAGDVLSAIQSGYAEDWNDSALYCFRGQARITAVTDTTLTLESEIELDGTVSIGNRTVLYKAGFLHNADAALSDVLYIGDVLHLPVGGATYDFRVTAFSDDTLLSAALVYLEQVSETMFDLTDGGTNDIYSKYFDQITVTREVPDLDFLFERDNRLWGCSSSAGTIYASALGQPMNFATMEGLSTDAYAVAVGSDGPFTAACRYGSSAVFFKENKIHKVLGGYPAEYYLYSYDVDGVLAASGKSPAVIGEVLYYLGAHGVYAYTGSAPASISAAFGERRFTDGVGGTDGVRYYLSAKDSTDNTFKLLVYDTEKGLWMQESRMKVTDFARDGKDLYLLADDDKIYLENGSADDPDMTWMAQFAPFYESHGKKRYNRLWLRVICPRGSYALVSLRYDGGTWKEAGRIVGRGEQAQTLHLPISRCDKLEVRLDGKGPFCLLEFVRGFTIGSDV